jgi:hypothetical protein
MVSNPQRRVEWQSRLTRWRKSGLSIRQFCIQEGVSQPSFFQWRKRLAGLSENAALPVNTKHPATSPQQLESAIPDSVAQIARFLPVEIVGGNHAVSQPLEIGLPSGVVLRVPAGVDETLLRSVLRILRDESQRSIQTARLGP